MDLLTEYEKAQQRLIDLSDQEVNLNNMVKMVKENYQDKLRLLEDEKCENVGKAEHNRDTKMEVIKGQRELLYNTTKKVQRILKIMDIIKSNPTLPTLKVYYYSNRDEQGNYINDPREIYIDPIQTLRSDMYSIFNLYIVPNDKPKNKYALIIRGSTILDPVMSSPSRGYIFKINDNAHIRITIKDAPTKKELIEYIARPLNMQRIMDMIPNDLSSLIGEYHEAIELLKEVKWQIMYLESQKHYYEQGVSHGTEDPEYKEILKQLKTLKCSNKEC